MLYKIQTEETKQSKLKREFIGVITELMSMILMLRFKFELIINYLGRN
jgi:hypothetical protein